jgi:hypothetical protein
MFNQPPISTFNLAAIKSSVGLQLTDVSGVFLIKSKLDFNDRVSFRFLARVP